MIRAARPLVGEDDAGVVDAVLASGSFGRRDPQVALFEEKFERLVNEVHCVAVNSGTPALRGPQDSGATFYRQEG